MGFGPTGWDEHSIPISLSTLGDNPFDDVWDGGTYLMSAGRSPNFVRWNKLTGADSDYLHSRSELILSQGAERTKRLTVWWGKMWLSTADQAACCFEASISVVTTKTGGTSAVHPNPASDSQRPAHTIKRTNASPYQEFASPYPRPENY